MDSNQKQTHYATPEMVKQFLRQLSGSQRELPEFPEALKMMQERGLLSEIPLPKPDISEQMSREAFIAAYDRIPFKTSWVLNTLYEAHEKERQIALSDVVDITCAQHIHNYGYTKQTFENVFSFSYLFQGSCQIAFDDVVMNLTSGDVFIASPGFEHFIHTSPDAFAIVVVVRAAAFEILFQDFTTSNLILSEFFRKYVVKKTAGNYCVIHGDEADDELRTYIQAIACETMDKNAYYSNTCAISLLKLFLARAFRKYHNRIDFYQQDFIDKRPDANDIFHFIERNYQDITLEKLAKQFHFNRTYLSRYIHAHFQRTLMEIVTELKLSHAKDYLRKTNKSITEIASLVGYDSLNHFSKTFSKHEGMTATKYRMLCL